MSRELVDIIVHPPLVTGDLPGVGGRIKVEPEDFDVEEIPAYEPSGEGDVVYSPRGCWHGFNNTGDEDVTLVWGWSGAGSLEAAGYELP